MLSSLETKPVRALHNILRSCAGGKLGFDPYRDPRTSKKDALISYMRSMYSEDAIAEAVRLTSGSGDQGAGSDTSEQGTPVVSSAPSGASLAPLDGNDAAQLAAILARMTGAGAVNADQVKTIVDAAFRAKESALDAKIAAVTAPVRVIIETKDETGSESKDMGVQHHAFPDLMKACNARDKDGNRLNIWLAGPVGTGKTTAAHKVAEALGLSFHANSSLLTKFDVEGYIDAGGVYHRTALREAFENGGVYLGDEFDGWAKAATLSMNAILANGWARFPDGMVKRHPDCIIILAGNTFGNGATSDFTAREKQDASTLDRMAFLRWPIDEKLEMHFAPNPTWTARVQKFRQRVADRKIKGHMVTPRASVIGGALLAQGLPEDLVAEMTLRKGLTDDQWEQLQ
jgi:hypothetical protein